MKSTLAPRAYYNEHDPFAAAWLRELIKAGHIAPGDVDERSIEDVCPDDLAGYVQCHFFAGIGVWSHALRLAGWPDNRAIWTGSCPCQPFSAAGKGAGFDDERHLWPAFFDLIQQCNPPVVVGEQVASKDGLAWLDLVSADVEGSGRDFAAADLCAAGFGAPHIRQRSFWVAYRDDAEWRASPARWYNGHRADAGWPQGASDAEGRSGLVHLADAAGRGRQHEQDRGGQRPEIRRDQARSQECVQQFGTDSPGVSDVGDASCSASQRNARAILGKKARKHGAGVGVDGHLPVGSEHAGSSVGGLVGIGHNRPAEPTNGFWSDADWLGCRDGKWRPVEPGTFPLAHGAANRVGRLRGYGNAIVGPVAQGFIEAVMAVEAEGRVAA